MDAAKDPTYDLTLTYQPGTDIPFADALSRPYFLDTDETLDQELEILHPSVFEIAAGQ